MNILKAWSLLWTVTVLHSCIAGMDQNTSGRCPPLGLAWEFVSWESLVICSSASTQHCPKEPHAVNAVATPVLPAQQLITISLLERKDAVFSQSPSSACAQATQQRSKEQPSRPTQRHSLSLNVTPGFPNIWAGDRYLYALAHGSGNSCNTCISSHIFHTHKTLKKKQDRKVYVTTLDQEKKPHNLLIHKPGTKERSLQHSNFWKVHGDKCRKSLSQTRCFFQPYLRFHGTLPRTHIFSTTL